MANRQERPKKGSFPLAQGIQVLVTGTPVNPELAQRVRKFSEQDFFIGEWCAPTGEIGYIDAVRPGFPSETITKKLQELAEAFPSLDVALSFMSAPPGSPGLPVVTFLVKGGKAKRDPNAHLGHRPPKRLSKLTG